MTRVLSGENTARAALAAAALWVVVCVPFAGWNALRNPMDARENALEERLKAVKFVPEELPEPDEAPLKMQRATIIEKTALWQPLIAAPAAAPPPESKPDLLEKLKGVTASLRDQIRTGDSVKIKVHLSPEDKRGRWMSVGDKINGLTIAEIKAEAVVLSLEQNGKQFTAELPRR